MRRTILLSAIVLGGAVSIGVAAQDRSNVEITAQEIKPGVAVLFGNGGNIGVSHGPDGTFIVDDQFADLTQKIQAAIAGLGASPVKFLVNTHWHFDHTGGNANFGKAGAVIVAQENVRKRLAEGGLIRGVEFAPEPREALPVVTYDHSVSFHLNGDTIDVIHTGGGHTDGDSVIYWRKANVLHTGDMMMNRAGFPFVDLSSGGSALRLITSLDQMIAMTDAETVVIPGHGPLSNRAELIAWRGMIAACIDKVKALKDAGSTLDQAKAAKPLAGMSNAPSGFISEDEFVEAIWGSLAR